MTRVLWTIVAAMAALTMARSADAADPSPAGEPRKSSVANFKITPDEQQKIEAAIPAKASASPARPRKLLIFCLNVGYGGHRAIAHANLALTLAGRKTGAFETVISDDPEVFRPASLRKFDAVFFNNTVGNPFTDPELRQSLSDFVYGGGGLMGAHGTTATFMNWPGAKEDWPEFGRMIGARGTGHRDAKEPITVRLDEPGHPLNTVFGGKQFELCDEFFRFQNQYYSRQRDRVLLSIDTEKTNLDREPYRGRRERPDNDYALAWVRNYGRGRVFYCSVAHSPQVFWDPTMLKFYLGGVQFVLGDLPAPALPSARLTPAVRAQEKLDWRLAITAYTFHKYTLFETIDKTVQLGLPYLEGLSFQKVSAGIPKNVDPNLSDAEINAIREKLDTSGVRMLTYFYSPIPGDEAGCRKVFEFGRKLGIECFLSEPDPKSLDTIERFCNQYNIHVALHNHDAKASPNYWHPKLILKLCEGRGPHIGACGDLGYWMRGGVDPVEAARLLKGRLLTVQMHDLDQVAPAGIDVPWGTGAGGTERFLREVHALGIHPMVFGVEYSRNWLQSMPEAAACIEFFNKTSLRLAQ